MDACCTDDGAAPCSNATINMIVTVTAAVTAAAPFFALNLFFIIFWKKQIIIPLMGYSTILRKVVVRKILQDTPQEKKFRARRSNWRIISYG